MRIVVIHRQCEILCISNSNFELNLISINTLEKISQAFPSTYTIPFSNMNLLFYRFSF